MQLCVIGCGDVFAEISASCEQIDPSMEWHFLELDGTDDIQLGAQKRVECFDASTVRVFAAVDYAALNYARFELFGKLRLMGYLGQTLIHPKAYVSATAKLGENCWVGAGAHIGHGCKVAANTFIGARSMLDSGVRLGSSCWIGAGSSIGRGAVLGAHCVVGNEVKIARDVSIGRNCVLESPLFYQESLADGTFIHPSFQTTVQIYSPPQVQVSQEGRI